VSRWQEEQTMADTPTITQPMIDLYDDDSHRTLDRRLFHRTSNRKGCPEGRPVGCCNFC